MSDKIALKENVNMPQQVELQRGYESAIKLVDDVVLKNYVSKISEMAVVPLDEKDILKNVENNVRFFKITEMVYEKDEYATYKFASVFNSLAITNCAVFIIMHSDGEKTEFYMGVRSSDENRNTSSLKETLQNALKGQFPGIKTQDYLYDNKDSENMCDVISKINVNNIASVSCVANSKDEENRDNQSFIQGLEKLALAMQGEKYTAMIIANGTPQNQLSDLRRSYENIYTQLSPFAKMQLAYSSNESFSLSDALTHGTSSSDAHTVNESYGESESFSESHSVTEDNKASKIASGVAAVASTVGAVLAPFTGGISLVVGGALSAGASAIGTGLRKSNTENTSKSKSTTKNTGTADTKTESVNDSTTQTETNQRGIGQNLTLNSTNKVVEGILEKIDLQLDRIKEFESLGMWECAAYFMADKLNTVEIAASTYKALMRGENSGVEISAINSWDQLDESGSTKEVGKYLVNFMHPVFEYNGNEFKTLQVTPCSLVSGNELAIHMGLPRKSVCGFPVIEHSDFGKEVVSYDREEPKNTINLGKVFNMGSETANLVKLCKDSLSMHAFVTGSTGSGKSNTVYEIIRQLKNENVKFMVIEPAKGEYKNVFGNQSDVEVLGTNPDYSELLKINPFRFPNGIHVLEHIDRLIEILNVCWPMYAAMPAILKEATLQAYEGCGWDLVNSKNYISDNLFPTFADLLNELETVIENSAYSQELKGNYIGSLVTRVKSLTNGLNGQIFSADEYDNKKLFDENVIVDLSRVGSSETKSLIMGILVMRLTEYRMSTATSMNQKLKHVTILEEAHNILKRTSTEQNPEAPSMGGKSVEMLSNSIAEMRTYGEGFIIADQSPNAVDISAIRNTNTKIIMRLPDESDRRLAGKAAGLTDEQLEEITKLPKGVAVVYQNDWIEPVLCKVNKCDIKEISYRYWKGIIVTEDEKKFRKELMLLLLKGRTVEQLEPDLNYIETYLDKSSMSTKNKLGVHRLIEEYKQTNELSIWQDKNFKELSEMVTELITSKSRIKKIISSQESIEDMNVSLCDIVNQNIPSLSRDIKLTILQCFMRDYADTDEKTENYALWKEYMSKNGVR